MRLSIAALAFALVAVWAAPLAARAEGVGFEVKPTSVVMPAKETTTLITVRNLSSKPMRLQVDTFLATQRTTGDETLTKTDELVAFPNILALAPHESKALRIGLASTPGSLERSYRLKVTEIGGDMVGSALQIVTAASIPVFQSAVAVDKKITIDGLHVRNDRITFALANRGNTHVVIDDARIVALDADGKMLGVSPIKPFDLLAGAERRIDAPFDRSVCTQLRGIRVEAKSALGTTVSKVEGRCS